MSSEDFSKNDLIDLLERLLVLAWEAGARILQVYERGYLIETKTDESPVTEADMGAHEVIVMPCNPYRMPTRFCLRNRSTFRIQHVASGIPIGWWIRWMEHVSL